jgi:NTP pyrophosphatase (non-canonical NTP hydrolase)
MTIQEAQAKVDDWIHQIGGGYFSELTNLGILTEEVGEMARWIVRKYGDQTLKPSELNTDMKAAIEDEMTDILWVLICLANQMEIDLTSGLLKNIQKKTDRDYTRHQPKNPGQ